jgi:hypothetical protein
MECTKCRTVKNFEEFSYKNESEKIYYLYCDLCREKIQNIQLKYKEKAKENYNLKKNSNIVECVCGVKYICFREYHEYRHINSKKHKKLLKSNTNSCLVI